jgi:hypothetical protein
MATGLERLTIVFFFMAAARRESNFPATRRPTGVLDHVCASREISRTFLRIGAGWRFEEASLPSASLSDRIAAKPNG